MCICYLQEFLAEYTNWKYQIKWKGFCYGMIWNKFNVSNEINKISTWNKIDTYITIFGTTYIHVHVWILIVKKKNNLFFWRKIQICLEYVYWLHLTNRL